METQLRQHYGERVTDAALRMSDLPEGTSLCALPGWPVFRLDLDPGHDRTSPRLERATRLYILPGVPHLLRRKWPALEAHLGTLPAAGGGGGGGGGKKSSGGEEAAAAAPAANGDDGAKKLGNDRAKKLSPFHAAALRLLLDDETAAAPAMAAASAAGGAIVSVGSYPLAAASCDDGWGRRGQGRRRTSEEADTATPRGGKGGDGATVCLLLESKDAAALSAAVEAAIGALPAEALVAAERDPEGLGGGGAEQAR